MLRSSSKSNIKKLLLLRNQIGNGVRHASSSGGSGGGIIKTLGVLTVAGGAGTVAYAKYDSEFNRSLRNNVPYSDVVLDAFGVTLDSKQSGPAKPTPPAETPASLLRKKLTPATDDAKKDTASSKSTPSKDSAAPPLPTPTPPPSKSSTAAPSVPSSATQKERENFAFEQKLREAQQFAQKCADEATEALSKAQQTANDYTAKIKRAMDDAKGFEDKFMWEEAQKVKKLLEEARKRADAKATAAKDALTKLEKTIASGLEKEATKANATITAAENTLHRIKQNLDGRLKETTVANESARIAGAFKEAVERGRLAFQQELDALLPEGKKLGDPKTELTEAELNVLVAHAHKRIEKLIKELSRYESTEDDRAAEFRKQLKQLDKELEKERRDVEATVQKRLAKQKEDLELELQATLRRQVGVHTEHLREALHEQEQNLRREAEVQIEQFIAKERTKQAVMLSEAVQKLTKMEEHLIARAKLDEQSRRLKRVWLTSAALEDVLTYGTRAPRDKPQPLGKDIVPLKEAMELSPVVKEVVESIPEEALKVGVYTERAMKERFHKVEDICRRVAMIDQNGGSLIRYALSYLQSLFIIYPTIVPAEELTNEQKVNPEMWDTFDVLSRVRAAIQREDMEQALRYANQLKGKARDVASDWIKDLRLLLETRQAARTLMAYAAATVAQDASAKTKS